MELITGNMKHATTNCKQLANRATSLVLLLSLCFLFSSNLVFAANKKPAKIVPSKAAQVAPRADKPVVTIKNQVEGCKTDEGLEQIVARPENLIGKEICFSGVFSAFSALALDYPPALRERKKYISLTLFRPKTKIPLGELKLAMKIEDAQKHELLPKVTEGDTVRIKGKVFSAALGEPWVDVQQIQITKNPNNKDDNSANGFEDL
jgi:hypothetical protein